MLCRVVWPAWRARARGGGFAWRHPLTGHREACRQSFCCAAVAHLPFSSPDVTGWVVGIWYAETPALLKYAGNCISLGLLLQWCLTPKRASARCLLFPMNRAAQSHRCLLGDWKHFFGISTSGLLFSLSHLHCTESLHGRHHEWWHRYVRASWRRVAGQVIHRPRHGGHEEHGQAPAAPRTSVLCPDRLRLIVQDRESSAFSQPSPFLAPCWLPGKLWLRMPSPSLLQSNISLIRAKWFRCWSV